MKKLAALFLAVSASSALAGEANIFNCKGQDIELSMTTSSFSGSPTLILGNPIADGHTTHLTDVKVTRNEMGNQVSGSYPFIADAIMTYTLIVPSVNIGDHPFGEISGMVVRTIEGTFFGPNAPIPGPRQNNTFTPVVCAAHQAAF